MMKETSLRGTRLGTTSYENVDHVELAPRHTVTFHCPEGHSFTVPFADEAEVTVVWECRCGREALVTDGVKPEGKYVKPARTHWDMLLERRTIADLEVLLNERLELLSDLRSTKSA
jgi:hypothetical protein